MIEYSLEDSLVFICNAIWFNFILFYISDVRCELSLNNHLAYQTSALLRDYVQVEPRVKTLLISLRFWVNTVYLFNNLSILFLGLV